MTRVMRDVLVVVAVVAVLIFVAGAVGQRLGNWTDQMPPYVAMLVWIGWEGYSPRDRGIGHLVLAPSSPELIALKSLLSEKKAFES